MATSIPPLTLPPPPPSSSNKEKANHTRLCRLLVDIGRQVLQDVFDKIHPPSKLNAVLWSPYIQNILKNLKTKKILYGNQWNTLFPKSGTVTSADLDITLLFLLLRNISSLKTPGTGWDKPPLVIDDSKEADIVRIKRCRNELYAHIVNAAIPDNEFQTLWGDIETVLVRLGGSKYQVQIRRYKHETIDPESDHSFNILLQSWEEDEHNTILAVREGSAETLVAIRELHQKIDKVMMGIKCTIRVVTATELVSKFIGGAAYILDRYREAPDGVIKLVSGAIIIPLGIATAVIVHKLLPGCFKILVEIRSLDALDAFWKSYKEGDMKENLEKVIVTDELRSLAKDELKRIAKEEGKAPDDVKDVYITLEISEHDYGMTRDYLLKSALRNYVEAPCTSSISTQMMNVGLYLKDRAKQTKPIAFVPGMIEWKVIKKLLTKARGVTVIDGKITLDISDPIDAIVHALFETSANLNVQDTQGKTPLIFAIEVGRDVLVEILVKAGADVNIPDESDTTPLMYAARSGNYVVAKLLIDAGAEVNALKNWDKTPLMYAAELGNSEVVKLLLESGARANFVDKNEEPTLLYAAESGNSEVVKLILKYGASVYAVGKSKKTPLMYAAKSGNDEMAKVLKEAGADVNAVDEHNRTALMYAAKSKNNEVAKLLIKAGANVNAADKERKTPLMYAATPGNKEVAKVLKEAGADVNAVDEHNRTALMYAAKSKHYEVAKLLIEDGDNVNAADDNMKTPLMYAAESENNKVAELLIEAGAEVNAVNRFVKTPLMYAAESKNNEVAKLLIKAGANVNAADK